MTANKALKARSRGSLDGFQQRICFANCMRC